MWKRLLCVSLLAAGCRSGPPELTVCAAASLHEAIDELARLYASHARITASYGSSGMLLQQIEHGAPADVFLSAAPGPMDRLQANGLLLPGTRRDLLRNEIVLVTPRTGGPASFQALADSQWKLIALGDPGTVPAGDYGKQVLVSLNLWDKVRPRLVLAQDVRQVLGYVETGNADAGIVYATDAELSGGVRVAAIAPESTHAPVLYPVAALSGSRHADAARALVEFIASPEAAAVFKHYGFTVAAP